MSNDFQYYYGYCKWCNHRMRMESFRYTCFGCETSYSFREMMYSPHSKDMYVVITKEWRE